MLKVKGILLQHLYTHLWQVLAFSVSFPYWELSYSNISSQMYKNTLYSVKVLYSSKCSFLHWAKKLPWRAGVLTGSEEMRSLQQEVQEVQKWAGTVCRASSVLRCTVTFCKSREESTSLQPCSLRKPATFTSRTTRLLGFGKMFFLKCLSEKKAAGKCGFRKTWKHASGPDGLNSVFSPSPAEFYCR